MAKRPKRKPVKKKRIGKSNHLMDLELHSDPATLPTPHMTLLIALLSKAHELGTKLNDSGEYKASLKFPLHVVIETADGMKFCARVYDKTEETS